ncbi:MAG TPA: thiamine pyrophosphate-dependent enzyme [Myxococcota bacterium]|nr:thiamine pyrophosphate-dependent enzyme [Myxococcota bacterium]
MFGLKDDWSMEVPPRYFTLEDYEGGTGRWCPGCGDFAVLSAVQRLLREKQLRPEKVVCVSGIGCAGRFPHYMGTYGFHGLHGRALPVAEGIKCRRPDLDVWVATGDGDCCSIGAGHWLHAIRYNMNMVVLLFDNNIYGLTKKQTSPTTEPGEKTNTHPRGAWLPAMDPLATTLGMTNASFVAQTVDWNPPHLYETLKAAHDHRGLSFVRILQRCPTYTDHVFAQLQKEPERILVLSDADGIPNPDAVKRSFENELAHAPSDLAGARALADRRDCVPIGLLFKDATRPVYDDYSAIGIEASAEQKLSALETQLDRFAI